MESPLDTYKGRSVLITGGLGFIGSNLARALVELGNVNVTVIDALVQDQGGNWWNIEGIKDRLSVHVGSINDAQLISRLVNGIDVIFNLAGNVSHLDSMIDPHADLEFNCAGHLTLLDACRTSNPRVKIVFASTRQVYGASKYLPVDEAHAIAPLDINGIHKRAAELYHLLYHRVHGIHSVCLRLSNTYGPRQLMSHNRQGFIGWFIRQAIEGGTIELFGDGKQKRDLVFVDDVVEAMLLAGAIEAADGEVFNVGGPESLSLRDIADRLVQITGQGSIESVPFPMNRQPIDIGDFSTSYGKIEARLGWVPRTDVQAGLAQTVNFYLQNHERYWPLAGRAQCEVTLAD
jgi:UDP-glucose 4-epimerase